MNRAIRHKAGSRVARTAKVEQILQRSAGLNREIEFIRGVWGKDLGQNTA